MMMASPQLGHLGNIYDFINPIIIVTTKLGVNIDQDVVALASV